MDRFERREVGIDKNAPDVDVIASGYEWICPVCNQFNKEIEYLQYYTCSNCSKGFPTNCPEHALG